MSYLSINPLFLSSKEQNMFNRKMFSFIVFILACIVLASCNTSSTQSDLSDIYSDSQSAESSSTFDNSQESGISQEDIEEESKDLIGDFIEETDVDMETYTNYIMDGYIDDAWEGYGFGDPFIMRYNGKYYLYSSTKDRYYGIKVWVSDNLVDWTYGGLCTTDRRTVTAYAPEVTYYNGKFYMVTSPAGQGHYILESSSPLGPFNIVTSNLGNSIDGHIFIDDNGSWYFYHAAEGDLAVKIMTSPHDLGGADMSAGVSVEGGWTEGPMVIKRDGVYYLTYCGNHVWSRGYRIEGAVGSSPLLFQDIAKNIILLNTDNPFYGLGHSSTVLGPDMDTYYIVYHSFGRVGRRRMHIDPIALNGKDFCVLGPTSTPQQMPKMPEIFTDSTSLSDDFTYTNASIQNNSLKLENGGTMFSNEIITAENYTAEVNFLTIKDKAGILFSYIDDSNYAKAVLDAKEQTFTLYICTNGTVQQESVMLPKSFNTDFDFNKLQALSMKKDGNKYTFYFNGLMLKSLKLNLQQGKFGIKAFSSEAHVGYTAISFSSNGSSLKDYYKPIEGTIPAVTCVEDGETANRYGVFYEVMKEGFIRNYYVNVGRTSDYDVEIIYYAEADTTLELYRNGECLGNITLPQNKGAINAVALRNINLDRGFGVISFKAKSGKANILSYKFTRANQIKEDEYNLDSPYYKDGMWEIIDEKLIFGRNPGTEIAHGKVLYGKEGYGDYSVEADFTFNSLNKTAGFIIRGSNPSLGGAGNDSLAGRFFYQGYYIGFDNQKGVLVYKVNYDRKNEVVSFPYLIESNVSYKFKVEAINNTLKIYVNGALVGEYTDNYMPFLNGAVGFTGLNAKATVENLKIEPITTLSE
jgi:hypothetical protein